MENNGSPLPEFETDEAHDYFITRLFVREGFYDYIDTEEEDTSQENGITTQETTKETLNTTKETTKEKIINIIQNNPEISVKEIAEMILLTEDGARYHLNKMRKDGIIEHQEPTKGGRWVILKKL